METCLNAISKVGLLFKSVPISKSESEISLPSKSEVSVGLLGSLQLNNDIRLKINKAININGIILFLTFIFIYYKKISLI